MALATALKTLAKKISKIATKSYVKSILKKAGPVGDTISSYMDVKAWTQAKGIKLTKGKTAEIVFKKVGKKLVNRKLGSLNFIRDAYKYGAKQTARRIAFTKLVPGEVRKLYYMYIEYKKCYNSEVIKTISKKELWKVLGFSNHRNTYNWKLDKIEEIMDTKVEGEGKQFKEDLLNHDFVFRVKSPETRNFSQTYYKWNPTDKMLRCSIRSANGIVHHYTFKASIEEIRRMVNTTNYGRNVYWKYYK